MTAQAGANDGISPAAQAEGWRNAWTSRTGSEVAWLFHRLLALVFLVAWLSLGSQVRLLIGARGLLPLADFVDAARAEGVLSFFAFPSVLAFQPSDGLLLGGVVVGVLLAVASLVGLVPRLCSALQLGLYLSYVTACRAFLTFQWDSLLLESALLATFLPTHRRAPVVHFLFRALLFKLYFESGLAKWQSPLGDWRDGSAMTFYYQTAPLPTWLGWYAYHLPVGWHHFESWATLVLELVVPFAIFGPRRARRVAAALLTLFQLVNAATANYGFFCYLSACLHLFLLDDRDVARLRAWVGRNVGPFRSRERRRAPPGDSLRGGSNLPPAVGRGLAIVGVVAWVGVSLGEALFHFGDPGALAGPLTPVIELSQTYRFVNPYHLFAAVTRQRIEPELQIQRAGDDADVWTALVFHYKPGPVDRPPPFVAPHQPRVDFLLWFYGLSFARRQPGYVSGLLSRLCEAPDAVASLFTFSPPRDVRAVRLVFWDYRFTTSDERRATAAWWTRRPVQTSTPVRCSP